MFVWKAFILHVHSAQSDPSAKIIRIDDCECSCSGIKTLFWIVPYKCAIFNESLLHDVFEQTQNV